jgi:hypothetical protein
MPVCRAGILLAHLTHAPNLKVQMSFTMTNLCNVEVLESFEFITDWRAARWAEFYYSHDVGPDLYKRRRQAIFFIGGLQIDPYGNTNLIGIGSDFRRLKMRGPGGVGTASMATNIGRYYLYVNNHNKQTLTERVEDQVDVAADDILERERQSAIRHRGELDACHHLELLRRQVADRARARRGVGDLRVGLGLLDQPFHVGDAQPVAPRAPRFRCIRPSR